MNSTINLLTIYLLAVFCVELIRSENSIQFQIDLSPNVCSLDSDCQNKDLKNAFHYLKQYGYLSPDKTWNQLTTIELSIALTRLQEFSGLPMTGYLDQNLIDIMKTSRCSEPDFRRKESNSKSRQKRSTIGAFKWVTSDELPDVRLNWFVLDQTPKDDIQRAADLWNKAADIRLKRLTDLQDSYFYNILFNSTTDQTFPVNFKIKRYSRETDFLVATNIFYISFNVTFRIPADTPPHKVLAIMVHMWGHILGLEHTKNPTSIMWPFFLNKTEFYPSREDIADIQMLYGPNPNASDSEIMIGLNPKFPDLTKTAPNLCLDSKIDSILELSDGVWVMFKGQHYFRIGPFGPTHESPRRVVWDFKNFSSGSVDASLSWNNVVFLFSGSNYWKYIDNQFIVSRKISDGFPGVPDGPFDDVFKWNVNQKVYFFKDGQYWKYDSTTKSVPNGYPKKISDNWKGIPDKFDAAISSRTRNQTYFFVDKKFYRFDDIKKQVVSSSPPYPRETEIWFVKCRNTLNLPPKQTIVRVEPEYKGVKDNDLDQELTVIDNKSYWEGVLIIILVISILTIVICGVLSAYLYFVVLLNLSPREQQQQQQQQQQPAIPMQPLKTEAKPVPEHPGSQTKAQPSGSTTPSEKSPVTKKPITQDTSHLKYIDSGSVSTKSSSSRDSVSTIRSQLA